MGVAGLESKGKESKKVHLWVSCDDSGLDETIGPTQKLIRT
jgi:hypothetical protein